MSAAATPVRAPSPTGRQFELRLAEQTAVITEVGASLRRYADGGRDVVVPFGAHEQAPGSHGAVLLPWPNRIGDGTYVFDGEEHRLALTEPERRTALHGLVQHTRWIPMAHTDRHLRLALDLVPRPGYPFPLHTEICCTLGEDGLTVDLATTNPGTRTAPYGVGFHPWLSPGRHRLDDCTLQVDAAGWVRPDERLLPLAETELPRRLDFLRPRRLGTLALDDGFVDVPRASTVRLTDPDGVAALCWAEDWVGCWQLCTGDGLPGEYARSGLAAEPMTCAADAFRTGRRVIALTPGQTHEVRWGLRTERP